MTDVRRVLHLRSSGGLLGAEAVILQLAQHSQHFGYDPIVGVLHDLPGDEPELAQVARDVGLRTWILPSRGRLDVDLLAELRHRSSEIPIDVVHTHGYRENIIALAAFPDTPRVATNHLWKLTSWKLHLYALLDAIALRFFPQVIGVSVEIVDDMARRGIPRARMGLIPNGIDVEEFFSAVDRENRDLTRAELGIAEADIVILMVSSLTPEKGHEFAIRGLRNALERYSRFQLVIAGAGPERPRLEHLSRELGLSERVHWLGWRRDTPRLLSAADVFLMPSLQEGLPIALLEAMAARKAIIATPVGDIADALGVDGGVLVPVADDRAVADALVRLAENEAIVHQLGSTAFARVSERYSSVKMARRYCAMYDLVVTR